VEKLQIDWNILTIYLIVFVISLPTKLQISYVQYNYLHIYIIYGFVSFVANLLDRATDGTTVSVRKCASLKELLFVRFSVCKIIVFIKGA
jgi:hypothetical protein